MYKTEEARIIKIEVDPDSVDEVCGACPTIFDFEDTDGTPYYFRLRHGYARVSLDDTEETLISGDWAGGGDEGICTWSEVVAWAAKHNLFITEER